MLNSGQLNMRFKMTEIHSKARIRWACRRGMLELDVLFMPFVEDAFDSLSVEQQAIFQRLLTEEDPDLFVLGSWAIKNVKMSSSTAWCNLF